MSTPADTLWTIQKILTWTSQYFEEKGLDSPRLDAELLLAHALHFDRTRLYIELNKPLQEAERARIRELVKRRACREPVSQIIGRRGFWKSEFKVTRDVLTPRPDTERLIERAIEIMRDKPHGQIVDVGTGSGCVAISLALDLPQCEVLAIERSIAALAVAQENGARLAPGQVQWLQGDLLGPIRKPVELIVSNPPYIPSDHIGGLMPEVSQFEPREALDGGPRGLEIVQRLVEQASSALKPQGLILLEMGHDQGEAVRDILSRQGVFQSIRIHQDYGGRDRVIEAQYVP